jgi:hypothetical protein
VRTERRGRFRDLERGFHGFQIPHFPMRTMFDPRAAARSAFEKLSVSL